MTLIAEVIELMKERIIKEEMNNSSANINIIHIETVKEADKDVSTVEGYKCEPRQT